MRRIQMVACLALVVVLFGGCVWTTVVVAAQPAIRAGVVEGIEYGDAELALGLDQPTKDDLADKVTAKVVAELQNIGEDAE